MTTTDDYWYCPFAYGYSNYARTGYAKNVLHYGDVISIAGKKFKTTLGGTGLAVSAFSKHTAVAVRFASMVVSPQWQRTLYAQHGGQPGHLTAWLDADVNHLTHNFFNNTLPVLTNGYIRPRYNGYLHFQDNAGSLLQECILQNSNPVTVLNEMNIIYKQSLMHNKTTVTL